MNKVERWKFLTPLALAVLFIAAMVSGAWANEFAATTNSAVQKPNILIGATNATAGDITINESAAGALSKKAPENTFYIQLPVGVSFATKPTAVDNGSNGTNGQLGLVGDGGNFNLPANATLTDTDGDGGNDTAEWSVNATSETTAAQIRIGNIRYTVSPTVAEGDIDVTIDSEYGNPGLTPGTVANAYATASGLIVKSLTKKNVEIGGNNSTIGDIVVTEAVAGACTDEANKNTITLTLPTGVTWNNFNSSNTTVKSNGGNWTGANDTSTVTITCVTATTSGPGQYKLTDVTVNATSTVPEGDINLTVGGTAGFTSTVAIATAKKSGVAASALMPTLPKVSQGSLSTFISGVKLVENFLGDVNASVSNPVGHDNIKVTLPAGVTFAKDISEATLSTKNINCLSANASKFRDPANHLNFVVDGATPQKFEVNIGDSVPVGDLDATVEVTLSDKTKKTFTVKLADVVAAGVNVTKEYSGTTPSMGTDSNSTFTGNELKIKIAETSAGAIRKGSAITVALSGATFVSKPTGQDYSSGLGLSSATLSDGNTKASFVATGDGTTASPGYCTINLNKIKAGAVEGKVVATVTVLGKTTELTMANVFHTTQAKVAGTPTSLNVGSVGQLAADMQIIERFKGALNANATAPRSFRLVLSGGLSFASAPTVTYTGSTSPQSLTPTLGTTFTTHDTVEVTPNWGTLSVPATIDIKDVYLNVPPTAADGPVVIQVADGNMSNVNGCGVCSAYLTPAYVGAIPSMTLSATKLSVPAGSDATFDVTDTDPKDTPTAQSSDTAICTVAMSGMTATVHGVAEGNCTITVTGNHSGLQKSLPVTVTAPAALTVTEPASGNLEVYTGKTGTITVAGGVTPYKATSSDSNICTVSDFSGSTTTVTGVAAGTATVTITDSADPADSVDVAVTVTAAEVPIDPPATHNVDSCDAASAPMTVANGVMDVNFNYTAPVEVIGGVLSQDFSSVWWLTSSCILSTDYAQAATSSKQLSCTNVTMPAGSEHGYVFWLVAPSDTANFNSDTWWKSGVYELSWYKY